MKATIFDYGAGNLHSLIKAIEGDDIVVSIERHGAQAISTDVLVLPGVGAFATAVDRLGDERHAMRDAILGGLPIIGICLGMQLLFERSEEGRGEGLGVIPGDVTRLEAHRIPQIGWNQIEHPDDDSSFAGSLPQMAYFANSFACRPRDERVVRAWTTHERDRFPSVVRVANTVGVQFHPEKSSADGVRFLRSLVRDLCGAALTP